MSADLSHVEVWLFDLDNTLYPPESDYMALIRARMTGFVSRELGLPWEAARALQLKYLQEHGTTLAGLMAEHGTDPEAFMDEVHDVEMDRLAPDADLRAALSRLPGRRLVFTNGGARHAERVLERLRLDDLFEDVFHVGLSDYIPKPDPRCFDRMIRRHAVDPNRSVFFEDSERNLAPAAALGMTTVLVGPEAAGSRAEYVHHRTTSLPPFLDGAKLKGPSA